MPDAASLRSSVSELAERAGLLLVDLSWVQPGRRGMLRVLVDRPGRVTIDECAAFSRMLEDHLDREMLIDCPYILEVGSPGVGRRLESEADWIRSVGRILKVESESEAFTAELLDYSGGCLSFEGGRTIPVSMVQKAFEVLEEPRQPGRSHGVRD